MKLLLSALLALGLVAGIACGEDDDDGNGNGGPQAQVTGAARPGSPSASGQTPPGGATAAATVASTLCNTPPPAQGIPPVSGDAQTTASGLRYIDLKEGSGASPAATDTVTVHYSGWLEADGTRFDSSCVRGAPATFPLNGVIAGWTEGVSSMKVGGTRRLIIPADLAYGAAGRPSIPGGATLVFDIELLAIE
jgi:hypothetical protein